MPTTPDRRVRRTRRLLHSALLSLVSEKRYERITVQDILDRADVGRSTFYAHFRDKDELLVSGFDELRQELGEELERHRDAAPRARGITAPPTLALFEHAYRHRRVYWALVGRRGGDLVHDRLHEVVSDMTREHLRPFLADAGTGVPADVVVEFLTSSLLGLLTVWLGRERPESPAHMARAYHQLATPGLRAVLGAARTADSARG